MMSLQPRTTALVIFPFQVLVVKEKYCVKDSISYKHQLIKFLQEIVLS